MNPWLPMMAGKVTTPGGGTPTLTFRISAVDGTDTTTPTFTSQDIGPAASRSHVLVSFVARFAGAAQLLSATIGGVSATVVHKNETGQGVAGIIGAVVPSGTTATIVLTFDQTMTRSAIGVYSVVNLSSLTNTGTNGTVGTSGTSTSLNTVAPSGDSIIIGVAYVSFGADQVMTWTGLTKDADAVIEVVADFTSASAAFSSSGSKTISLSWPNSSTFFSASCSLQ